MRTFCHELDRRSAADYQMSRGKQRNRGLGRRELQKVLATLIFLALVVGAIIIVIGTPEVRRALAELFGR